MPVRVVYAFKVVEVYDKQAELGDRMFFKPTDAPHYMRIVLQRKKAKGADKEALDGISYHTHSASKFHSLTRGCLAGTGFCFISHVGDVQGCGYLDVQVGNVTEKKFTDLWQNAVVFQQLRDCSLLKGKCGVCEYRSVCGGCRARAYEATGDFLAAEPYCVYQPERAKALAEPKCE